MRVELHPCFLLHKKAYRETSLLLEVFSKSHGRIGLVAKGAMNKKLLNRNLQSFNPLLMAWSGRGDLGNLINAEPEGKSFLLAGDKLFIGYYINELLIRLLHRHDPHPQLFDIYQQTLDELVDTTCLESTLRLFEKRLLEELGYGLILDHEIRSGENITADQIYDYVSGEGPFLVEQSINSANVKTQGVKVSGRTLLLLSSEVKLEEKENRVEAKKLMRYLLSPLLGDKPLKTRKIFETMKINEVIQ